MSPRDEGRPPVSWIAAGVLLIGVGAWTILIVTAPAFRFNLFLPQARPAIETAGGVIALLTSALAYLRLTLTGERSWLFIAVAFLLLGANQLVFGAVLQPGRIGAELAVYLWTAGRLLVAVLLLLGARARPPERKRRHTLLEFVVIALAALATLAAVEALLWGNRNALPPLSTEPLGDPERVLGPLPGLTPIIVALGAIGTALYLVAALLYLRSPLREASAWLAPGLVLAAFSHIHYSLFPTVFSGYISTGDVLRLAFSAALLGGVMWDVSRTYRAEQKRGLELAAAYEAERARARELEALDRAKAELFGILTHELMNPVAAVRGFAVTLARRWPELNEEARKDMLLRIDRESIRLRDLAEEAGTAIQLEGDAFSVTARLEGVAEVARQGAEVVEDSGQRIKLHIEPTVREHRVKADLARILQVFRNLLSNALKYSPQESPVELRVEAQGSEAIFSVIDQGPGIPAEGIPRLFHRFSRLRLPGMEELGGSGLGLYISRQIVEAHSGRIWVESEMGIGTAFRFSLPLLRTSP